MDVQNDFRRAISKQVTGDSVVVPTNVKSCVFVTNVVSNLDESGRYEFHGTAMTLTSHLTHDEIREDPTPDKLDLPEGEYIQLPIGYAIVPHIEEYAGDVTLLSIPHTQVDAGLPEESWLQDAHQVVEWNAPFSNQMISNND